MSSVELMDAVETADAVVPALRTRARPDARTLLRHALLLAGLFVLLSAVYWAGVYAVGGQRGMPLDDSYIHLQYARGIHEGHPFEYNYTTRPGVRSGGTSAPLWTAMIAGMYRLVPDWLCAAYTLGVLWTIPTIAFAWWLIYRWTASTSWALLAATLVVVTFPTVISAYEGMEPSAYTTAFLLGLLLYDFSRTGSVRLSPQSSVLSPDFSPCPRVSASPRHLCFRLAASAAFAIGVWLRPEFLLMTALIAAERAISLRRDNPRWLGPWLREMTLHALTWAICIAPYMAFNLWVSGTLMPNTYTIKAIARNAFKEVELLQSIPAAWLHRDIKGALLCLTAWQLLMAFSVVVGLLLNNAVLTWKLPRALREAWRGGIGPAGLLACLSLVAFPIARTLVDPSGLFPFQFQRYFAHLTPLLVLLGIAWLAKQALSPSRRLVRNVILASLLGPIILDFQAVKAVDNINDMHVTLAHYIRENTPPDSVVAVNDVGALAFYSERRVIDTVGLTEPGLGDFYLAGGTLEEYLRREKPQYACFYRRWHGGLAERKDLFQAIYKVHLSKGILDRNWICGGSSMLVLRTCWDK